MQLSEPAISIAWLQKFVDLFTSFRIHYNGIHYGLLFTS